MSSPRYGPAANGAPNWPPDASLWRNEQPDDTVWYVYAAGLLGYGVASLVAMCDSDPETRAIAGSVAVALNGTTCCMAIGLQVSGLASETIFDDSLPSAPA
jgi:hypothetical protein